MSEAIRNHLTTALAIGAAGGGCFDRKWHPSSRGLGGPGSGRCPDDACWNPNRVSCPLRQERSWDGSFERTPSPS